MSSWLVLPLLLQLCRSQDDLYPKPHLAYRQALALLDEYSSLKSNLTHIHWLLQSAADSVPEALAELGEFYFFGYPVSPDSEMYADLPDFLSPDLRFRRNFTRAIDYLHSAVQRGAKKAESLLAFILQQGLLTPELNLLNSSDVQTDISTYQQIALIKGSEYARASAVAGHIQCKKLYTTYLPEFLDQDSPRFYTVPYFEEFDGCMGSCDFMVPHAMMLASEAIQHYSSKGGIMNYDIGPLREVLEEVEKQEAANRLTMSKKMAETGNQHAVSSLADNFLFGNTEVGIDRDADAAMEFYAQAADGGNMAAMQNLGILHLQGIGGEKNYTKALYYLQLAAAMGSAAAYNGLGYMTEHGLGVEANSTQALEYFKVAAAAGYAESQSNLGIFYLQGQGVPQDFDMALHYFETAALSGHLPATFNLGVMYENGYGVKRSCKKALELFDLVAKSGRLAVRLQHAYYFYRYGDFEGAYLSYAMAASLGYTSGMLSAAYMWETQRVPYTCVKGSAYCAGQFYAQAVLQESDSWAYYRLGDISFYGSTPNYQDAVDMYVQADIPEALFALAYMYEHGLGVSADVEKARELYLELVEDWEGRYPAYLALVCLQLRQWLQPIADWLADRLI